MSNSTYQDFHRVIKETIQVDSDPNKRWTPQVVKFINHNNEFYGKFSGVVNATELIASNIGLSNVSLSGCKIYDLSGNVLSLDTIFPEIKSIRDLVDRLSTDILIDLQNEVYTNIPNKINHLKEYVDDVSSDISVLMDQKIEQSGKQGSKDLSVISSFLQSEIEQEWKDRYDNDKALSDIVSEISSKIKGGVVYRGEVIADKDEVTTMSSLIRTKESSDETLLYNGYMYVVHYEKIGKKIIEGKELGNGDYIIINTNDSQKNSIKVSDVTSAYVDVIDAMNQDVYVYIKSISSDVVGLKDISSQHETRITSLESKQNEISGKLDNVIEHVDGLNGLYELNGTSDISVITKISQDKGKISIDSKKLISSDVTGLKDFVENEISLSVKNIKSSVGEDGKFVVSVLQEDGKLINPCYSKITDSFIDDNTISKNKINNLTSDLLNISSDLSSLIIRDKKDLSYFGTVEPKDNVVLSLFVKDTFGENIKRGFTYRLNGDCHHQPFVKNDYIIFNKDIENVENVSYEDIDVIHDFSHEVQNISSYIYSLNNNVILTSDSYVSVFTNVEQKDGKLTFGVKELISSDINGLSDWVAEKINELDVTDKKILDGGYIISSLSQVDGKIDYGTRKIVSSDIQYLEDYVKNEINLSVESLDSEISANGKVAVKISMIDGRLDSETSEFSKIDDSFIEDQAISQYKINGLSNDLLNISSDLSTVIRRNKDDVSLKGDFQQPYKDVYELKHFLYHGTKENWNYVLRKGFMYRLSSDQRISAIEDGLIKEETWNENDYVIVREDIILSDATFNSFYYIKDYDKTISSLSSSLEQKLSVTVDVASSDIYLSVYNVKQNDLCVGCPICIPKVDQIPYTAISSDTISLSVNDHVISGYVNESSIGTEHLKNVLSVDYSNFYDKNFKTLSDVVELDNTFNSMYNGIVNIISECKLTGYDFNLSKPISSAFDTINNIAKDPVISVDIVELDVLSSKVSDGFNALNQIIISSNYKIHRTLDSELNKIENRFDVNERSIATHTEEISALKEYTFLLEQRLSAVEQFLETYSIVVK